MSNPLHTRRGFHTACLYAFSTPDANVSAAVDATALIGRLRSVGKSWSRWTAQLAQRTSVRRISQGRLHARPRSYDVVSAHTVRSQRSRASHVRTLVK